ncbi:MAG: hypothetical protein KKB82_06260 [Candidatus Omnitrophica bacterium]|nr:hypothetical protein [Candidatus Omnitrophota bacterium]MBU1925506.1 hypothetical protein [Candidatus Omnitrophota bacterium]
MKFFKISKWLWGKVTVLLLVPAFLISGTVCCDATSYMLYASQKKEIGTLSPQMHMQIAPFQEAYQRYAQSLKDAISSSRINEEDVLDRISRTPRLFLLACKGELTETAYKRLTGYEGKQLTEIFRTLAVRGCIIPIGPGTAATQKYRLSEKGAEELRRIARRKGISDIAKSNADFSIRAYFKSVNMRDEQEREKVEECLFKNYPFIVTKDDQPIDKFEPGLFGLICGMYRLNNIYVPDLKMANINHRGQGHYIECAIGLFDKLGAEEAVEDLRWFKEISKDYAYPELRQKIFYNYCLSWFFALSFFDARVLADKLFSPSEQTSPAYDKISWNYFQKELFDYLQKENKDLCAGVMSDAITDTEYLKEFYKNLLANIFSTFTDGKVNSDGSIERNTQISGGRAWFISEIILFMVERGFVQEVIAGINGIIEARDRLTGSDYPAQGMDMLLRELLTDDDLHRSVYLHIDIDKAVPGWRMDRIINIKNTQTVIEQITELIIRHFGERRIADIESFGQIETVWKALQEYHLREKTDRSSLAYKDEWVESFISLISGFSGTVWPLVTADIRYLQKRNEKNIINWYLEAIRLYSFMQISAKNEILDLPLEGSFLAVFGKFYQSLASRDLTLACIKNIAGGLCYPPLLRTEKAGLIVREMFTGVNFLWRVTILAEVARIFLREWVMLNTAFNRQEKEKITAINGILSILKPEEVIKVKELTGEDFSDMLELIAIFPYLFRQSEKSVRKLMPMLTRYEPKKRFSKSVYSSLSQLLPVLKEVCLISVGGKLTSDKSSIDEHNGLSYRMNWLFNFFYSVLDNISAHCESERVFCEILALEMRYFSRFQTKIASALARQTFSCGVHETLGRYACFTGVEEPGDIIGNIEEALLAIFRLAKSESRQQDYIGVCSILLNKGIDFHPFLLRLWQLHKERKVDGFSFYKNFPQLRELISSEVVDSADKIKLLESLLSPDIKSDDANVAGTVGSEKPGSFIAQKIPGGINSALLASGLIEAAI